FVSNSPETNLVRDQIRMAVDAQCDTILISGETGTGKEVAAREIHFQGDSDHSPFIAVSCPALPESLVESELFGHVKGAFTGATTDRAGYFEMADGGTLFLDEIADLSADAQAKMLRALETRTFRRVGGSKEISVNLRVVAATNTRLEDRVADGSFRQDLFYRLNVFSITLQPLRDRKGDILPLAEHFLAGFAAPRNLQFDGFSIEAKEQFLEYDFPGNARELRNLVERAAILCRSGQILPAHLNLPAHCPTAKSPAPAFLSPVHQNGHGERNRIETALENAKWNRRQAAKDLDMPYSTLRYKIQRLDIS
ncbi:MAG: sigma-54 dependent transcriptional regulator, partial [bacterium]|nr:sigma-54 dependent transcriptional regulator [bacterium]